MNFDFLKAPDKRLHMAGGSILASSGHLGGTILGQDPLACAVALSVTIIVAKEVYDMLKPQPTGFSVPDMGAGLLAAGATTLLLAWMV